MNEIEFMMKIASSCIRNTSVQIWQVGDATRSSLLYFISHVEPPSICCHEIYQINNMLPSKLGRLHVHVRTLRILKSFRNLSSASKCITFTATTLLPLYASPSITLWKKSSVNVALWTWPMLAVPSTPSNCPPSNTSPNSNPWSLQSESFTMSIISTSSKGGTSSCNVCNRSIYCEGTKSGRELRTWPNLIKMPLICRIKERVRGA